jgi:hypothetical protein
MLFALLSGLLPGLSWSKLKDGSRAEPPCFMLSLPAATAALRVVRSDKLSVLSALDGCLRDSCFGMPPASPPLKTVSSLAMSGEGDCAAAKADTMAPSADLPAVKLGLLLEARMPPVRAKLLPWLV